ncbi:GDSL esterase/lipase At3g48460 [Euphorbia lathyris]|uniref:GDSL esterase/lipase At3g48460 n=1 Tax=Euphorbia lathyris TaxID=212925 RepID=UPI0033140ED6
MATPSQLILTLIFFSASIPLLSSSPTPPFKKIYAFGDSFTDTGNTKSATGPSGFGHVSNPPYGDTFFHRPTNRYSDGRLMIDFVAESLSLPFLPPYLHLKQGDEKHGVNFAVAGSTAINHGFFVMNNLSLAFTPQSIQTQILWFNQFLQKNGCQGSVDSSPACRELMEDSLIWVGEIGVNDYAYITGSSVTSDTVRKLAISTVTTFLQELLKKGVKSIVVQGLPPTGCLPLAMTLAPEDDRDDMGCVKSVNNQTMVHNIVYKAKLEDLKREFPNATITYLDFWNAYSTVVKNPRGYGFKEPFKACCGSGDPPYNFAVFNVCGMPSAKACRNPSQYINWDGVHLTEGMYKVLTNMFLNGTYSQPPFDSLLH